MLDIDLMHFISFPTWVMVRWRRRGMRRHPVIIRRWIQPRMKIHWNRKGCQRCNCIPSDSSIFGRQFHHRHSVRFPCIFFAVKKTYHSDFSMKMDQKWLNKNFKSIMVPKVMRLGSAKQVYRFENFLDSVWCKTTLIVTQTRLRKN